MFTIFIIYSIEKYIYVCVSIGLWSAIEIVKISFGFTATNFAIQKHRCFSFTLFIPFHLLLLLLLLLFIMLAAALQSQLIVAIESKQKLIFESENRIVKNGKIY